jgi:hypothetical protein
MNEQKIDVFDITDKHSKEFLNSNFFYFPQLRKAKQGEFVTVELDHSKVALQQLIIDGYMVELEQDSDKFYLTGRGRNFILRGGYAQQFQDEKEAHELDITLKKNQKITNITTAIVGVLGFCFIVVSVIFQARDRTDKELHLLRMQLKGLQGKIEQVYTSLNEINHSILNLSKDTTSHKPR